jgi:hypothetical protein
MALCAAFWHRDLGDRLQVEKVSNIVLPNQYYMCQRKYVCHVQVKFEDRQSADEPPPPPLNHSYSVTPDLPSCLHI